MKLAIVGSRSLQHIEIDKYIPCGITEIVSGGAKGIDSCAAEYAKRHNIALKEFLPQYDKFGRAAPIVRNKEIVRYADKILVFWDGASKGTLSVINYAKEINKPLEIIHCE